MLEQFKKNNTNSSFNHLLISKLDEIACKKKI